VGSGTAITGGSGGGNHNSSGGSVSSTNPSTNLRRVSPSISLVPGPNGYFGAAHALTGSSKAHRQSSANSKGPGSVASSAYGRKSPASLAGVGKESGTESLGINTSVREFGVKLE